MLLLATAACREKPIDQGALLTARTVGLADLERGRLTEAEQEFRQVIALAPKDPLGYANLGLTYLRGGRFEEAQAQLKRARRLDPRNPEIALIIAQLYSLTGRPAEAKQVLADLPPPPDARVLYGLAQLARQTDGDRGGRYAERLGQVLEKTPANLAVRMQLADVWLRLGETDSTLRYLEEVRRLRPAPPRDAQPHLEASIQALRSGRLADARAAFDRFRRSVEVTAPYQAALAAVNWTEGPLPGNPILTFSPLTLITMRGFRPPPSAADVRFTDATDESGLPDLGAPPTALALGDYDGDGVDNLLLAAVAGDGRPIIQLYAMQQGFVTEVTARMPLPRPAGAIAATFVDYDNDGWLDLFVIGTDHRGYLLRNRDGQRFEDVTDRAGVRDINGARRALFVDLDHDGDLDLLLVGNESLGVYRNNADGSFALFPNAAGILQGGTDAAFADLDDDGRTDVFVASTSGTHGGGLFRNDAVRGFTRTADTIHGPGPVAMGDYDNDGAIDIFVGGSGLWHNSGTGAFTRDARAAIPQASTAIFFDYDNDGWLDLLTGGAGGASLLHNNRAGRFEDRSALLPAGVRRGNIGPILVSDLDGDGDQDILLGDAAGGGGVHFLRNDGGNSHLGMRIQLTGLRTGSSKNNTFGIGSKLEVRAGELYQTRVVTDRVTLFGLGPHLKADVLRVQWTNGVPQTIYFPGTDADVLELEALKGSCSFLYAWDGEQFRFVTDVMWRSALGMPLRIMGKGGMGYAPAGASLEYVRIPGEALQPKGGRYVIQVTEELWETAYVDQLQLLAVDHPDSVEVFVDERFPPNAGPQLRLFHAVRRRPPLSAVDGRGADALADLREHDFRYVSNLTPLRYQGLTEPHALVLDLDEEAGKPGTFLFLRGWIYPSDASINVALSQQQLLRAEMPVLEVRDAQGRWVSRGMIGFPAGKDKTVVIDLAGLFPTRDHRVRLRTSMQIYWDQAFVAEDMGAGSREQAGLVRITTLAPESADLHFRGFSRMYRRGGRYGPHWFAYDDVTRESPWRPIAGAATRFGDVRPLLERADDQYVVMAPGDETTVEFDASQVAAPPPGWTRTFLLYSDGWIKDSDLNTAYGTTIEPLPYHAIRSYPYAPGDAYPADSARQRFLREYNTRIIKRGAREER
ncbi:MAG: FG-GAP-like repeat-containing protein [Gemmatimonadales bacterium]